LSTVTSCDTLATEPLSRLVACAGGSTFQGAAANLRLLVSATQITVAIRLRLNAHSGSRPPDAETLVPNLPVPEGLPTRPPPCAITIRRAAACVVPPP
jgi:hypothetical protein